MSYCRWSSDGFRCDLYAYEDAQGWTIHVAGRTRVFPPDWSDPLDLVLMIDKGLSAEEATARYSAAMEPMETFPFAELTAPSAGKTFREPSLAAFRARLLALRAEGLRFPDDVLAMVDDEMAEAGA